MLIIGLTGILGSGKTTAATMFRSLGIPIVDMDEAGRWAVNNDETVRKQIALTFGEEMFDADGNLLREKLGTVVFGDAEKLKTLNRIVHPGMLACARTWVDEITQEPAAPYLLIDAALIFELEVDKNCDGVITVAAPLEDSIPRAMQRSNLSREDALGRIQAQWPQEKKIAHSKYVIWNDADLHTLRSRVLAIHEQIVRLSPDL